MSILRERMSWTSISYLPFLLSCIRQYLYWQSQGCPTPPSPWEWVSSLCFPFVYPYLINRFREHGRSNLSNGAPRSVGAPIPPPSGDVGAGQQPREESTRGTTLPFLKDNQVHRESKVLLKGQEFGNRHESGRSKPSQEAFSSVTPIPRGDGTTRGSQEANGMTGEMCTWTLGGAKVYIRI